MERSKRSLLKVHAKSLIKEIMISKIKNENCLFVYSIH